MASAVADSNAARTWSTPRTMRMPRPPPPARAFSITGEADALGLGLGVLHVAQGQTAGQERQTEALGRLARANFVAPQAHGVGAGSNEADAAGLDDARKLGVFGQEAVTGWIASAAVISAALMMLGMAR